MEQNENTIYNQVAAVSELNKVPGFDPLKFMRTISEEGTDKPKWYLDVKYRILWFRLCNPLGKIATEVTKLTDQMAVVESRIYLNYTDELDKYISKATSQKSQNGMNENTAYLEWAETAAIGRALTNAGYGIQFCDMLEGNDVQPTESGVDIDKITSPKPAEPQMPNANVTANNSTAVTGKQPNKTTVNKAATPPSETVNNNQSITFESELRRLSIEECKAVEVKFGKHSGKKLGEIAISDPQDIKWLKDDYRGTNWTLKAAATKLFDEALQQAS